MHIEETEQKRGPGRPRKEVEAGDKPRRRQRGSGETVGTRLQVNSSNLDFAKYKYRFVNDKYGTGVELKAKFDVDWDFVKNDGNAVKEDSSDMGDAVSVVVGVNPDGSPLRSYLMRKLKTFYDEDRKAAEAELDEQLKQLRLGNVATGEAQGDYVPEGGIKIA